MGKAVDCQSPGRSSCFRYATTLLALLAAPPLLLACFTVTVDPYYVFGMPSWPGVNVVRPFYEAHVIEAKPYQVQRIKPSAVALGSSRVEVGLNPRHPGWTVGPTFNFGLPSATSYEVMLAFLHAQAVGHPLKQAVVGLDFFGYNIFFPRNRDEMEGRFAGDGAESFANFLATELAGRSPIQRITAPKSPAVANAATSQQVPAADLSAPPDESTWNEALYLAVNPDVKAAVERGEFKSGADHYRLAGRAEGRVGAWPPRDWNEDLYLRLYPDVAAEVKRGTFLSGYHHYLVAGRAEGRSTGAPPKDWNEDLYLRLYPDVAAEVKRGTFLSGYHHYLVAGRAEGRSTGVPPKNWNEELYLKVNPDVRDEVNRGTFMNGYHHYIAAGRSEKREGGFIPDDWDEATYLQVNSDVEYQISQGRFLNGYHHYLVSGRLEKRVGGFRPPNWNETKYLTRNAQARIRVALGDYQSGYAHFAAVGENQRLASGFPLSDPIERLLQSSPRLNNRLFKLGELLRFVFSSTAVTDAAKTIFAQNTPASFNELGVRIWDNQDAEMLRRGGNGKVFRNNVLNWRWYIWLMPPRYQYCFTNEKTGMTTFDPYRFLLRSAYAHGTDLRLFMTPLHASVRVLFADLGLSERYDYWQKELVRINEEEAARAGRKPFPLWDFSKPNSVTREPVPTATDLTPMKWFWEFSHYRSATGKLILDRIFDRQSPDDRLPSDFGVLLTGSNLAAHAAEAKAGLDDWSARNQSFAAEIRAATRSPRVQNNEANATCW